LTLVSLVSRRMLGVTLNGFCTASSPPNNNNNNNNNKRWSYLFSLIKTNAYNTYNLHYQIA
jgi:hypothetical protein